MICEGEKTEGVLECTCQPAFSHICTEMIGTGCDGTCTVLGSKDN